MTTATTGTAKARLINDLDNKVDEIVTLLDRLPTHALNVCQCNTCTFYKSAFADIESLSEDLKSWARGEEIIK